MLRRALLSCLTLPVLVAACGDDGVVSNPSASDAGAVTPQNDGGTLPPTPVQEYSLGGVVSGLVGSGLKLGLAQKSETLTVAPPVAAGSNVDVTFTSKVVSGDPYTVVIDAQPTAPAQTCRFAPGTDTGTVTSANGNFALGPIPSGTHYKVVVVSPQPSGQTCTPSNNEGDASASDVTNVLVTCVSNCTAGNAAVMIQTKNQSDDTTTNQNAAGQLLRAKCCNNAYRNFVSNGCSAGFGQTCFAQAICN